MKFAPFRQSLGWGESGLDPLGLRSLFTGHRFRAPSGYGNFLGTWTPAAGTHAHLGRDDGERVTAE